MENSSTTRKSQTSSSDLSCCEKRPIFSVLWIVAAAVFVTSVMRRAAFPVGAQRDSAAPGASFLMQNSIAFSVVLFPVPGPPVIMLR